MSETEIQKMTFEAAMAELEKVVSQLESGAVPLAESIDLYERGAGLKAHCEAKLKAAEEKVAQIVQGPDGNATGSKAVETG